MCLCMYGCIFFFDRSCHLRDLWDFPSILQILNPFLPALPLNSITLLRLFLLFLPHPLNKVLVYPHFPLQVPVLLAVPHEILKSMS
jgi:hypothetical protein